MMATILDNGRLTITHHPGQAGRAIVSFAGVGFGSDGVQKEEFAKTMSGLAHAQYFVIDRTRTWYNETHEEIVDVLAPLLAGHNSITSLGNSMGGFGAIYFASRLPNCSSAIAFAPQFSVMPQIAPFETRWESYRRAIRRWPVPHALHGVRSDLRILVFVGSSGLDRMQAQLMCEHAPPRMTIWALAGQRHRLASYLRDRGALGGLLACAVELEATDRAVTDVLRQASIAVDILRRKTGAQSDLKS